MKGLRKLLSVLLTLALVITLIPPISGQANTGAAFMKITNFNTAPSNVSGGVESPNWGHPSAVGSQPSNVTTKLVTIEVEYNSISSENLSNLYYEVKNVETGMTREYMNNPPQLLGSQRIRFENVELTEGLNKVTIILNTTSKPQSVPAWINFTEVTTIQELQIDDRIFSNGIFVPQTNQGGLNSVWISGVAPNSTEVRAYTTADTQGSLAGLFNPNTGEFYFTAGDGNNAELRLRPGDNHIEIIARNLAKSYRTEREFVYNNGKAFLFNTIASGGSGISNNAVKLYTQPNFEGNATGPYTLNITTDIKINKSGNGLAHNEIHFIRNGRTLTDFQVTLSNLQSNTVAVQVGSGTAVSKTIEEKSDHYIIRDVTIQGLPIDEDQSRQLLEVHFMLNGNYGIESNTQNFVYYYVNNNYPYVEKVELAETNAPLYDGTEINLTNEEIEFDVFTRNSSDGIRVYTNHQQGFVAESTTKRNVTVGGVQYEVFTIKLGRTNLPEGRSTLRFVPYDIATPTNREYTVGEKSYLVNYNPTPYVYAQNIYNGQIFSTQSALPSSFVLVPVNIPRNNWGNIKVIFNDVELTPTINTDTITVPVNVSSFIGGSNILEIEFYNSSSSSIPVSTFKYELLYFEDNVPNVASLDLIPDLLTDRKFVKADSLDARYHTQEKEFAFETNFANAQEVQVIVNDPNESTPFKAVYRWANGVFDIVNEESNRSILDLSSRQFSQNGDFVGGKIRSYFFPMEGSGTYTVEITVTNRSGLFSTRMLEIVREPALYQIHYPNVNPATNTATVNGNFTRFYVEAEGADKIIYGKGQEVTDKQVIQLQDGEHEVFAFEVKGLKKGNNKITFTIVRGTREDSATVTLINADTAVVGAQVKENISSSRIRAFNREFDLSFPKGTILHKKDTRAPEQSLSPNHDILVGIADPIDGRVNKTLHPLPGERSNFRTESGWDVAYLRLYEPTSRFRQVSKMYWVDAGIADQEQPFEGGLYPYERGLEFYKKNANDNASQYVPSQPGQLTLSYNPNIVQSAWRYVTVYHYGFNEDHQGVRRYEWKNIGGVVNQKNNTITVPFYEFGYYVVMYMDRSYDDIIGHPWARDHLDTLFSKGMMIPKESTRFVTNEAITRGEFASLLVKAFEIPLDYEGMRTFTDVVREDRLSDGTYAYKYIETAARAGIVRGNLQGFFQPRSSITREDAAVMIARAANLKLETNTARATQQLEKIFTDTSRFGDYTIPSVLAVNKAGYIDGKPNNMGPDDRRPTYYFDPKANLTRAEAAAIMMRVMLKAKKIPSL